MTLLKCNTCNIVISEVLAFIQNKIQIMDEESIVRVCSSAFTSEDVDIAKTLLFKSVNTTIKKISRRKENKLCRDLEDIICVFKNTDPECVPIFVAKDLQKLPPLTFDHVDVSRLLKDIIVLQSEIKQFKEVYATKEQLEEVRIASNKSLLYDFERNVNSKRRGASTYNSCNNTVDCGPMSRLESLNEEDNSCVISLNKQSARSVVPTSNSNDVVMPTKQSYVTQSSTSDPSLSRVDRMPAEAQRQQTDSQNAVIARLIGQMSNDGMQQKSMPDNEGGWSVVTSRKKQSRFVGRKGTANVDIATKFKAADVKIPFLLYNVSKDVNSEDISNYVKDKTQVIVVPERIEMKHFKEYHSYKILIPKHKIDLFENDNMWPDGVFFRRYFVFKTRSMRGADNNKTQK